MVIQYIIVMVFISSRVHQKAFLTRMYTNIPALTCLVLQTYGRREVGGLLGALQPLQGGCAGSDERLP